MAAQYPGQITTQLVNKIDLTDIVFARDVNDAYDEIKALQTTVGVTPTVPGGWGTGNWATPDSFPNVAARIKNLENLGVALNTTAVRTTGGSTITASTASVVPLVLKGAASQTGNLLELQNSSGTVIGRVTSAGTLVAAIDGGTA